MRRVVHAKDTYRHIQEKSHKVSHWFNNNLSSNQTFLSSIRFVMTASHINQRVPIAPSSLVPTARGSSPSALAFNRIEGEDLLFSKDVCWPDWVGSADIVADDVSRFNATKVSGIFHPTSIDDIVRLLDLAARNKKNVTIRGTKHSMGGHTLTVGGIILDMGRINHIQYIPKGSLSTPSDANSIGSPTNHMTADVSLGGYDGDAVRAGAGALWGELIAVLNKHARAPRTLQSYCTFSVGGTMAVNGHGITTDYALCESILSFRLIKADGRVLECSRTSPDAEARELFGCVIGGYGLFGIVYDVVLKVNTNVSVFMETITLPIDDVPLTYAGLEAEVDDVEIKIGRIDITTFKTTDVYIFRRQNDTPTVSDLHTRPTEMSAPSRLMYKWMAGPLREVRFAIEQATGVALDWSDVVDRNRLLFESAVPLARLYSPLFLMDDTFILQEYFVPKANFSQWIALVKPLITQQLSKEKDVTLLNITIRVVEKDTDTVLPYSRADGGSFAFVLYYRLRRTEAANQLLASYHARLVDFTLSQGGTFYLPYQHHYSDEQFRTAYPMFETFKDLKNAHDPAGLFTNLWWERYGLALPERADCQANATPSFIRRERRTQHSFLAGATALALHSTAPHTSAFALLKSLEGVERIADPAALKALIESPSVRRQQSFRALLKNPTYRKQFLEVFIPEILNLIDAKYLFRVLSKAVFNPHLKDDNDIYKEVCAILAKDKGPITSLTNGVRGVLQVRSQKMEIANETVALLSTLGALKSVKRYCSVGDYGKLVMRMSHELELSEPAWIVHDDRGEADNIVSVLERGVVDPEGFGNFCKIDYANIRPNGSEFPMIPSSSLDLLTMNQGLHHLKLEQLSDFILAVNRVLKVGGMFIIREHDLSFGDVTGKGKDLMCMLDCAHMVFNTLTGTSCELEAGEIRAFRSMREWRTVVQSFGFVDSMVYQMQPFDPTVDFMMCFIKVEDVVGADICALAVTESQTIDTCVPASSLLLARKPKTPVIDNVLNRIPVALLLFLQQSIASTQGWIPMLEASLVALAGKPFLAEWPAVRDVLNLVVNNYVKPSLEIIGRFTPLTAAATPNPDYNQAYFTEELAVMYQILKHRANQPEGGAVEKAIKSVIDRLMEVLSKPIAEGEGSSASSNPAANGGGIKNKRGARFKDGATIREDEIVSPDTVRSVAEKILRQWPELERPLSQMEPIGFTPKQIQLVANVMPRVFTVDTLTQYFVDVFDFYSWKLFRAAVDDLIAANAPMMTVGTLLTPGHKWHALLVAVGSMERLSSMSFIAKTVVRGAGLDGFLAVIQTSQQMRRDHFAALERERQAAFSGSSGGQRLESLPPPLKTKLSELCPVLKYAGDLTGVVLSNVLYIKSCRQVTNRMILGLYTADKLAEANAALAADRTLNLEAIPLDSIISLVPSIIEIEYHALPATRGVPHRAKPIAASSSSDSSLASSSLHSVRLQAMRRWVNEFHSRLGAEEIIDVTKRDGKAAMTFFKLNEWMQVEIVHVFSQFMLNKPWYRFPFMDVCRTYFSVLFKITSKVAALRGGSWLDALTDSGFIADAIPGIVMTIVLAQMQLLAMPLLSALGTSYDEERLHEQVTVIADPSTDWAAVDERIKVTEIFAEGVHVLQIPPFKPFTEILLSIARRAPAAALLKVSNHDLLHVKLSITLVFANAYSCDFNSSAIQGPIQGFSARALKEANVTVNFAFEQPPSTVATANLATRERECFVSCDVEAFSLMAFLRWVDQYKDPRANVAVKQVYDFY